MRRVGSRRATHSIFASLAISAALLGAGPAWGQKALLLVDDGEFFDWTTRSRIEGVVASGARMPAGGNPGAAYRVVHRHEADAPFSPQVASESFFTGAAFDPSPFAATDLLAVSLDLRAEEDPGEPFDPPTELGWLPALRQAGVVSAPVELPREIPLAGGFVSVGHTVALEDLRPIPDLSPGAPPVEIGFVLRSSKIVRPGPQEVRAWIDNLTARIFEDLPGGLTFEVTDGRHRWTEDPLIRYELAFANDGPPQSDVVLTETVPVNTRFVALESSPGWSCDPGPGEGSLCTLALGEVATGEARSAVFAVRVLEGTPEEFEILDEPGFFLQQLGSEEPVDAKSHGHCIGRDSDDASTCRYFAGPVLPQHAIRCTTKMVTLPTLECCARYFLNKPCEIRCEVVCNVPCGEMTLIVQAL